MPALVFEGFMANFGSVFLPVWAFIGLLLVIRAIVTKDRAIGNFLPYLIVTAAVLSSWAGWQAHNLWIGVGAFAASITLLAMAALFLRPWKKGQIPETLIAGIDRLSPSEFEDFLLQRFQDLGYRGGVTAKGNHFGADLVLTRNGSKLVVRAELSTRLADIETVQQIAAAIMHYGADSGMVITNNFFTPQAKKLAASNRIELWERDTLIKFGSGSPAPQPRSHWRLSVPSVAAVCPKCGDLLIVRHGKNGSFWGCGSYPKCRHTEPLLIQVEPGRRTD